MKTSIRTLALSATLLCAVSTVSQAVVLAPDAFTVLPGTTVAAEPNLAGTIVVDELVDFSFAANGGTISGQVQNRVVLADDGTYDFYWRVFNDANSSGSIQSFRIGEFYTSVYDADWRIDGLGDVAPIDAFLFAAPFSSYVNFEFEDTLRPGYSSYFMFLDTDATHYAKTSIYDLTNVGQGEISSLYAGYAPVPAPATALLLGAGLLGMIARRRVQVK